MFPYEACPSLGTDKLNWGKKKKKSRERERSYMIQGKYDDLIGRIWKLIKLLHNFGDWNGWIQSFEGWLGYFRNLKDQNWRN